MQGSIQNSVAGVLTIGVSESPSSVMKPSEIQPLTQATSFSKVLGSVAKEPLAPADALVSTGDLDNNLELISFTEQNPANNGEIFPLEGQELPSVLMGTISNPAQRLAQQRGDAVQEVVKTSEQAVELDITALINSGQVLLAQEKNEMRSAYSAGLNGALQGGVQQQQIRNSLNQSGVIEENRANATAPLMGETSLFSTPNSAKLVDGLLRVGEVSVSDAKIISNESALLVQSLSASRTGSGEPISSLGIINSQNIIDKAGVLTEIKTPVNNPEWKADLGERVAWMASNKIPTAEIKINPSHLGPIEIKVSVNNEQQATVSMIASHGATREALEAAIPRLREILSDAGLQLADADVNSEQGEGQENERTDARNERQQNDQSDAATNEIHVTPINSIQQTGVDIFA